MKSSILATPAPVEYLDSYLQQVIGVAYEEDDCAYEDPVGPHYWWAISLRALEWTTRNYDGSAYDAWKHISKEFTKKYGYAPEAVSFTKQGRETILLIGYVQEEEEEVEEDPNILTLQEQLIRQSYSQT